MEEGMNALLAERHFNYFQGKWRNKDNEKRK